MILLSYSIYSSSYWDLHHDYIVLLSTTAIVDYNVLFIFVSVSIWNCLNESNFYEMSLSFRFDYCNFSLNLLIHLCVEFSIFFIYAWWNRFKDRIFAWVLSYDVNVMVAWLREKVRNKINRIKLILWYVNYSCLELN